jgi:hypothetical protein
MTIFYSVLVLICTLYDDIYSIQEKSIFLTKKTTENKLISKYLYKKTQYFLSIFCRFWNVQAERCFSDTLLT